MTPHDWIVDGTINLDRIVNNANWDLGISIRAAEYAGLSKEDAEAYVRWILEHRPLTPARRARITQLKDIQCQSRKP